MIWHGGWRNGYEEIARRLIEIFDPDEVLFVSFGSITLIKPVIQKIRVLGNPTKILQMELVPDPHGKLTYPDSIKIAMYRHIYKAFRPWHERVFFYLCMEKLSIWEETFGYVYTNNEEFEREFGLHTMTKCTSFKKINP
jgi:spore photoproduct lyase